MTMNFSFVPTNSGAAGSDLALDEIPQDVRDEVEEVYAFLKANPNGRMRTPEFPSKQAALAWQAMAVAYCKVRPAGEIRFRKSPTRGLKDTVIDFRITDLPVDNGAVAIRDAAAVANLTATNAAKAAHRK
jgi:hypothetical protein